MSLAFRETRRSRTCAGRPARCCRRRSTLTGTLTRSAGRSRFWQSFATTEAVPEMPPIPPFPVDQLDDPELRGYLDHAAANSTPRPEIQAIRAHVPEILRAFGATWDRVFRNGVVDHRIKELCRVYVSSTLECHY